MYKWGEREVDNCHHARGDVKGCGGGRDACRTTGNSTAHGKLTIKRGRWHYEQGYARRQRYTVALLLAIRLHRRLIQPHCRLFLVLPYSKRFRDEHDIFSSPAITDAVVQVAGLLEKEVHQGQAGKSYARPDNVGEKVGVPNNFVRHDSIKLKRKTK